VLSFCNKSITNTISYISFRFAKEFGMSASGVVSDAILTLKRTLPIAMICIMCMINTAQGANLLEIEPLALFNLGVWDDSGDVSETQVSCIASTNDANGNIYPYWVKVTPSGASGDFKLYLNGDTSSSGNSVMTIRFYHRDRVNPVPFEQLSSDNYESHSHDGATVDCLNNGDNSELKVEILASEFVSKNPGYYEGNFVLNGMGGSNGNKYDSQSFSVSITVQGSASQVKISGLDDVSFGAYSGTGDLQANETFCVYSTNSTYRLSISADSQDSNGNFFLPGAITGDDIPVSITFVDSVGGSGVIDVFNTAVSGSGNSDSETCAGSENATLTFAMDEQSLRSSSSGDYLETFIIMVEPE
jgi:hypothetical protein